VHHHYSADCTAELPDLHGQLSAAVLPREWQIDKGVICKVGAETIGIQQQCKAQHLVSSGDGGTLLVCNRHAEEGLNAINLMPFIVSLMNLDNFCGCYFKNSLWWHCNS